YSGGTLATAAVAGGAPRELATDVSLADWAPDGKQMAITRNGRLEFPAGKTIYTPKGRIACPRVSPAGDRIAFQEEHPVRVVNLFGGEIMASRELESFPFPAWSPSGDEIWMSVQGALYALSRAGRERLVFRGPRGLQLKDISKDGSVVLTVGEARSEVWSRAAGQTPGRGPGGARASPALGVSPGGETSALHRPP